jgi:copper(I)-binding protein
MPGRRSTHARLSRLRRRTLLAGGAALLALASGPAPAQGPATRALPLVRVQDAWVRGTVEGQTGSGAYLQITSSEDAQLVGASAALADRVEIHEMHETNGMMRMRRIDRLALPANTPVKLDHDYHLMLIGLHRQLEAGQDFALTLDVLDASGVHHAVSVHAPVRALNARPPAPKDGRR